MVVDIHIKSGGILEIMQVMQPTVREGRGTREPKLRVSDQKQIERNLRASRRWVARLINTNFGRNGVWIGVDYDDDSLPADYDAAVRQLVNLIRRIRAMFKRLGLGEFKYIAITEDLGGRWHHHIVMSPIAYQLLTPLWTLGGLSYQAMDRHTDYIIIANYITKQRRDRKFKKKWMQSKNLEKPEVTSAPARRIGTVKLPRGYKELERTIEAGEFGPCIYVRAIRVDWPNGGTGKKSKSGPAKGRGPAVSREKSNGGKL